MNFLASPPLVVAYALAGKMDLDLTGERLSKDRNGEPVYLKAIWHAEEEIREAIRTAVKPEQFTQRYSHVLEGDQRWKTLATSSGEIFKWDPSSTYVRKPPFFDEIPKDPVPTKPVLGARVLALLGDSV